MQNQTPPKSNQDAFNRVWQHFIVEKNPRSVQPVVTEDSGCTYRSVMDGGKINGCGIGCMLPDHLYRRELENKSVVVITDDSLQYSGITEWFKKCSRSFLSELQLCHDRSSNEDIEHFVKDLQDLAKAFKLTVPEKA